MTYLLPIEEKIEAAMDAGLIDEAHAAIVALDDLGADMFDCEPDDLEDTTSERVHIRCRCEEEYYDV